MFYVLRLSQTLGNLDLFKLSFIVQRYFYKAIPQRQPPTKKNNMIWIFLKVTSFVISLFLLRFP